MNRHQGGKRTFPLWARLVLGAVVAVALVITPFYSTPYANQQLTLVGIYTVVLLGLSTLTGQAGQVSLAQAAFFGLGAYTAAITSNAGWPLLAVIVMSILVPAVVGLLVALPAVRLKGVALAMLTVGVSLAAVPIVKRFSGLTGGSLGLSVTSMGDAPEWTGLARDQWAYFIVVLVTAVMFVLSRSIHTGKTGRAMAMIRTNEVAATAMGIAVTRYKVEAFVIAAAYAGTGGFLFAFSVRFVSVATLGFLLSIMLVAALVVGGLYSLLGSLIGAAFYVYVPAIAGSANPERAYLIYGVVLTAVIVFLPSGLVSLPTVVFRRLRGLKKAPSRAQP